MSRQMVRPIGMRCFIGLALIREHAVTRMNEEMGNTAACRG
jgi:hypothetical protein